MGGRWSRRLGLGTETQNSSREKGSGLWERVIQRAQKKTSPLATQRCTSGGHGPARPGGFSGGVVLWRRDLAAVGGWLWPRRLGPDGLGRA
jgi:hypothetical protein